MIDPGAVNLRKPWGVIAAIQGASIGLVLAILAGNVFRVDTLQVDNKATVGATLLSPTFIMGSATTVALSPTTNDTPVGSATLVRTTASGVVTITGIDSTGRGDGSLLWIQAPTSGNLSFIPEDSSSLAKNRIDTPTNATWSATAGGTTLFSYNATSQRWQLMEMGTAIFPSLTAINPGNSTFNAQTLVGSLDIGVQNTIAVAGVPSSNVGTVPTGSSDWYGAITGIGANSSVTLTFSTAFANRSFCVSRPQTGTQLETVTTTAAHMVISCVDSTTGSSENCVDLFYTCAGN